MQSRLITPRSLALAMLLAAGCGTPHPDYFGTIKPKHPPDELWVNNGTEAEWLDPNKCSDSSGGEVIWNLFAGLVEAHPKTLAPMPDIATHWDVSEDRQQYTFHLRPSQWSDGVALTAHDFEYSFKRILDPATASKYVTNGYIFKNGELAHKQALLVDGLPEEATEESVKAWAAEVGEFERVEVEAPQARLYVKLPGEDESDAAPPDRAAWAEALQRKGFQGSEVTVRVAGLEMVGVEAVDDLTLRVELENPIPYFLNFISFYSFMPIPRHVIERLEKEGKNPDLWTRVEHIVSNGAFVMTGWRFRQHMIFEKNPRYWNAEAVKLNRVKMLMIENYNTALNMYYAGEMDWTGGNTPPPSEFLDYLQQYKDCKTTPELAEYFYWVNTERPPMDNPKLREAMSLAIDRESLVKHITRGGQVPSRDLVPDGLAGYEGLKRSIYDPDRARELLREAGYESGADVPPITLIYNTSEGHKQIAEAIQQMWKKVLGIEVQIENQEWQVYLKNASMMNFQIARMGWIGDYADPFTFLELLTSASGNNHSNWSSREYDEMMRRANAQTDPQRRLQILREAEAMALAETPVMPLYVYTKTQMVKPYLKGIWPNYQDRHLWKYVSVDDRWYDDVPDTPADNTPPPEP